MATANTLATPLGDLYLNMPMTPLPCMGVMVTSHFNSDVLLC